MFELNLDDDEYVAAPYPPQPLSKAQTEALGLKTPQFVASAKPTLRIETTTLDTGERKDFFGHTARHVITTRRQIPLEGSKSNAQEMVTDGWYIDLDISISCDQKRLWGKPAHAFLTAGNAPIEKMEFVDKGEPESGFAIESKITTKEAIALSDLTKTDRTSIHEMRVTQLVEGPLDPGLFIIPTGFAKLNISTVIRQQISPISGAQLGTVSKQAWLAFSVEGLVSRARALFRNMVLSESLVTRDKPEWVRRSEM
jgi:hypothetical protein